jgi:hypothetical protein
MPQHFRVSRALVRSLGSGLLLAVVLSLSSDSLLGQAITGLAVLKTCPSAPQNAGSTIQCTFSVQNQDPANTVINLAVTNQAPFPGGPIVSTSCTQGGSAVTTLGANGTATDTCTGTVNETAPACTSADTFFADRVSATGTDTGASLAVNGAASNAVIIAACTPTPTNTPVNTPTNTPVNTPTNTPPPTVAPPVPTLSFPMMAMLGLLLAGAGLFLARRQ